MFNERLPSREASEPAHLARMIALLGPPPKDLPERGQFSSTFFDEEGAWLPEVQDHSVWYRQSPGKFIPDIKIEQTSLEDEEETLEVEEKKVFMQFLEKMIQWRPEDRLSAKELMEDPWLDVSDPCKEPYRILCI